MKKVISYLLAGAMVFSLAMPAFAAETDSVKIYVSAANGNDAANGATLNSAVKTPARAQELAQANREEGVKTEIIFEAGEYLMDSQLSFTSADSGTADAPVVYRAYQGADVKFTTAKKLEAADFTLADNSLIPSSALGEVMVADVTGAAGGLADTVYQLGEMQTVAGCEMTGSDFDTITMDTDDDGVEEVLGYMLPASKQAWVGQTQIQFGYFQNSYSYVIGAFHTDSAPRLNEGGMFELPTSGTMKFMNTLSELDEPGEYYVDATSGKLYYYPKYDIAQAPVYLSQGTDAIVKVAGAEYIAFEGIDLFCGGGYGYQITNSNNITVYDSSISGFADYGVYVLTSTDILVAASSINDMKKGGIYDTSSIIDPHKYTGTNPIDEVIPDEQLNLVSANNTIRNTNISNFGKVYKTTAAGIEINNVGTTVANCEIHDAPFRAISFTGNDHVIENNEIYNVITETWDSGAIYTMRSWIGRGTVIRNNFIYMTADKGDFSKITTPMWYNSGTENQAIYLDDLQSGITVTGNIIYNMSNGIMAGGGSDHVITDNVMVNCRSGIVYDNQGEGGWRMQHIDPAQTYQGKIYQEANAFLDTGYDTTLWNKYGGFSAMIERLNTFNEAYYADGATDTEKTAALKVLGAVYNRTVNNNIYTGPWAEWSIGEYVPEGGEGKTSGATWTDSNGTQWTLDGTTYKLLKNGSYVGAPTHISMATAYESDDTNANTAMTMADAGVTILSDGNITVGSKTTADMGIKADSYIPSYSAEEDGVNAGNNFTVVAAVYDAAGALKAVNTKKDAFMQDGQMSDIDITVPEGATSDWKVKLMLWDSLSGLTPIAEGNIVLQ